MRKAVGALTTMIIVGIGLAGTAVAQDDVVIGTVVADPATVPEAGEYTFTATGSDYLPDTSLLLVKCVSPAETLVPGESSEDEIVAAALAIDALADCDIASAQNVEVDADGGWTAELTAEVGDNFFLSAGALDGTQAGATWVPIIAEDAAAEDEDDTEAEEEEALADTGLETGLFAVVGLGVLGAGTLIVREARRIRG